MNNQKIAQELLAMAKELVSFDVSNREMRKFVDYFQSFYGEDGLYPIINLSKADILKGVRIRMKKKPDMSFEGDSSDREMVRDIVLRWRKMASRHTARDLTAAVSDEEFIADQLNNAWEVTSESEMLNHLARETRYDKSKLRRVIKKWYDDVRLRMKMDTARMTVWIDWLQKELG